MPRLPGFVLVLAVSAGIAASGLTERVDLKR